MPKLELLPRIVPLALVLGAMMTTSESSEADPTWADCVVDDVRVYADHKAIFRCEGSGNHYYVYQSAYEPACGQLKLAFDAENYRAALSLLQTSILTRRRVSFQYDKRSQCHDENATTSIALL